MMLLLAVIYLIFISLGLPDSLFGAAWPIMHIDFNVNESFASIYMIITAVGSGGMSFFAGPIIRKFGTGIVTVFSVMLTAVGMLVIGIAPHIAVAIVGSIMMGLGAGAIDTGLNSYVSNHYKASHMNWLHAFWGVGVTLSPLIMSFFLDNGNNWRGGYNCVAYIQLGIMAAAALALPLWFKFEGCKFKKTKTDVVPSEIDKPDNLTDTPSLTDTSAVEQENIGTASDATLCEQTIAEGTDAVTDNAQGIEDRDGATATDKTQASKDNDDAKSAVPVAAKQKPAIFKIIKMPGVLFAILSLGFYTGMEFLIGTWGASYAVNVKAVTAAVAARWVSLYYGGIMIGRVISGFLSYKFNDKMLIRMGIVVMLVGMVVFALPIGAKALVGLLLIGIGFGPIFPSTIHSVPLRFGAEYSADITGIQMGGAYLIGWAVQLIFGFVAPNTTFTFMPYLLIALAACVLITAEITNKKTDNRIKSAL